MIVGTEFQTNPLSHKPGGSTVVVEFTDGRTLEYENIKNTSAYINMVRSNHGNKIKNIYTK